jgi:hypothetical protein
MPLGYEVFAGNRNDSAALEEIVEHIEGLYGRATATKGTTSESDLGHGPLDGG